MANIELLKRLRTRFLRMRHRKHFDMEVTASKNECGTAMCIAGHALDLQGYKVKFVPTMCGVECCGYDANFFNPNGKKVNPLRAAAEEMGIPYDDIGNDEGFSLFHDFSLKTPKQAAKRIEMLIEKYSSAKA